MISPGVPPAKLARLAERLRHVLSRLHQRSAPAPAVMLELIFGAWVAQGIAVAAELRVADVLADGPLAIDELARRVDADPDALGRLLRALIGEGIFTQRRDGRFALNPLADSLRRDAPVSVAGMARFVGSPQHREHWSHLVAAVRTGEAVVPALRGKPSFEYLLEEPDLSEIFNDAMTSISELAIAPVIAAYDFAPYPTIVDVGGGHGRLLAAILGATPGSRGVLYDLPPVVAGAPALLQEHGVADRVRIEGGSFFDAAPGGGNLYVLKSIIHDWPDDEAVTILGNIRAAVDVGTTLVLVETVIPANQRAFPGKWTDLEMLVNLAARERTADEHRRVLQRAGFRMTRIVPTASPFSLVEGKAV